METKDEKVGISISIDKHLLEWMQKQVSEGEFESQSSGIRRCILIAKRVYENATPDEMVKFLHGKIIKKE